MVEIIPTIIAKDLAELKKKAKLLEPYFDVVQLDVMDGRFVSKKTFSNIKIIKQLKMKLRWELHLMIEKPEEVVYAWSALRPKRFIFHFEAVPSHKIRPLIKKIKNYGMEAGMALNPKTPLAKIEEYLVDLDMVLLMTVNPGLGGQEFLSSVLPKIRALRRFWPKGRIEVDGGVKIGTAGKCVGAGANALAIGSAILGAEDIKKAISDLKRDTNI